MRDASSDSMTFCDYMYFSHSLVCVTVNNSNQEVVKY